MNLLFYSPDMEGHPQVYCRVLADILANEGHRVVIAGSGKTPDWPREWSALLPLVGHASVHFVDTRPYSADGRCRLRAEELLRLQRDHSAESTLMIEGDRFADEYRRIADGQAPRLHGRVAGIFAHTSGWYPREQDYGGAPIPVLFGGGTRATLRRARDLLLRRRASQAYFYRTVLLRRRAVDAVVVKDERVAARFGPPVHWMPEMFRVFGPDSGPPPADVIPADMRAFIDRAGPANVLLYFGTGTRYKGYDLFLKMAELDDTSFALHAGAPLRDQDRRHMAYDVEAIRARLGREGRLFETGAYVSDDRLVDALFHTVERFASTHRMTLSSGTMLQALAAGRPVLTASTGQVGHRTRNHRLGLTYRYGDPADMRDQWRAFRAIPAAEFSPAIRAYMERYSRESVASFFRTLLTGSGGAT